MELVQKVIAEVEAQEVAEIAKKAHESLDELGSDRKVLQDKAWRFLETVRKNRTDSQRGPVSRLLRGTVELRTEHYYDWMQPDFVAPLESEDRYRILMKERRAVYSEEGRRTLPFGEAEFVVNDTLLSVGWQVGVVQSRSKQNPIISSTKSGGSGTFSVKYEFENGKQIEPVEIAIQPIRIWRIAQAATSKGAAVARRQVIYDIDRSRGEVSSYSEDFQNDEIRNFSTNDFAVGMLQNAIEFIDR